MLKPIQAVIWDLDGVIIDSADEHRRAWQRLAREEGITMTDADFWATFGKRNDDIFAQIWGNLPPESTVHKRSRTRKLMSQSSLLGSHGPK